MILICQSLLQVDRFWLGIPENRPETRSARILVTRVISAVHRGNHKGLFLEEDFALPEISGGKDPSIWSCVDRFDSKRETLREKADAGEGGREEGGGQGTAEKDH